MESIIKNNPNNWVKLIKNKYGVIIDEYFWYNNPVKYTPPKLPKNKLTGTVEIPFGAGFDIHKWIGKLPKPKAGWTPGKYKYIGPYNPLE